jgi:hypothetical protein
MKAITLKQPWAWAVVHGKPIENRKVGFPTRHRGPLAIHAGKGYDRSARVSTPALAEVIARATRELSPSQHLVASPKGAVLAVVDLVDVHHADICRTPAGTYCSPWAEPDVLHLVLRDPRVLLEPVPYRGQLGLWTLPDDVLIGSESWDATVPPGGVVCTLCGMPVESEPCELHGGQS